MLQVWLEPVVAEEAYVTAVAVVVVALQVAYTAEVAVADTADGAVVVVAPFAVQRVLAASSSSSFLC